MLHRLLAHLAAVLFVVAFAAPAMAHVHGGHPADVATVTVAQKAATTAVAPAEVRAIRAADPAPCDRDCGHDDGMSGCACMAACLALTAAEMPRAAMAPARLAHGFDQTPPIPGAGHHPPVPPPRS